MVLRESTWRPAGSTVPAAERKIDTSLHRARSLPKARPAAGSWPSFRGPQASGVADGQHLPDGGTEHRREHPLAHADSRTRAFEPDRLGRSRVRHDAPSAASRRDVQAWPVRRRRCVRRSLASQMDALRDRQAHRQDRVGARGVRGRAARQAAHQVDLRERDARDRRPHRRRLVRLAGRLRLRRERHAAVEGRSRARRHGRLRHPDATSGGRRARRSSGTVSSSCSATRRPTRSCWRSRRRRARRCGRRIGTSCRRGARRPSWRRRPGRSSSPTRRTSSAATIRATGSELWRLGGSSKITAPTPILRRRPDRRRQRPRARAAHLRHHGPVRAATSR